MREFGGLRENLVALAGRLRDEGVPRGLGSPPHQEYGLERGQSD